MPFMNNHYDMQIIKKQKQNTNNDKNNNNNKTFKEEKYCLWP